MRRSVVPVALSLLCSLAPNAAHAEAPTRVYLLAGPNDIRIWTTDPADPSVQQGQSGFGCKAAADGVSTTPCVGVQQGATGYLVPFAQGAELRSLVSWDSATAPSFHFELDIALTTGTASVSLYMTNGDQTWESPPATQVSPGVFEGRLSGPGWLDPSFPTAIGPLVRVTGPGHFRGYTVKGRGASYVDFATALNAKSFPQLISESTHAPEPTTFASMDHWFTFNDSNWEIIPFQGNTSTVKQVPFSLSRTAPAVYAYVDDWSSPVFHRAVRRQDPDSRALLTVPILQIYKDDVLEASGPRSVATPALPGGDYVLEIQLGEGAVQRDIPYQGYLLLVHGDRTLASVRSQFPPSSQAQVTSPFVTNHPPRLDSFVVPEEATTMRFDLEVDAVNPVARRWDVPYSLFGYGGGRAGDDTRAIVGGAGSGRLTVQPAYDQPNAGSQDVMFDLTLSYTYTPPPPSP